MSVIVMGMEMPKKPGEYSMKISLFVREDGTAGLWGLEEYILHEPLDVIPLPEKHGRLIDGDELADGCDDPYWCRWLSEIEDMPTIVEAEGD